jgi:hypothetical protein
MKRFILEIAEDEKNRIRMMHESIRSNLFEQEQVTQEGGEKYSNQVMIPTPEDAKLLVGGGGQPAINNLINKATKNNGKEELNSQLVSSYGDNYKTFIEGLSKSPNKTKNASIWYLQLTQDSRIAFLNQWKAYLETANKKIQKGKQEVKITLIEGKKTTEQVDLPSNITSPPDPIVLLKEFNEVGKGMNVYEDNKTEVTTFMQGEIQKIIAAAQDVMNKAKESGGSVVCKNLEVAASSSRLRNTNEAANKTWAQLSKERAENVKNSLVTGLQGIGVDVPTNVIFLKGGFNGDGTSGPNPPKTDNKGKNYNLTSDGITIIEDNDQNRNSKGTPHADINDYLQYKFCIISVTLQVTWSSLPESTKQFEEIVSKNFTMEIKPVVNLGQVKIPADGFATKLLPGPSPNTKKRLDICPAFGG